MFTCVKVDKYKIEAQTIQQLNSIHNEVDPAVIQPIPQQSVNNQIQPIDGQGLIPPIPSKTVKTQPSGFKRFLNFLPISGSYFVKDPTEEQKNNLRQKTLTPEEKLCKVCYTNNGNTIVNACGHGGMCDLCAKDIVKKFGKCMICRQKIDRVLVIKQVEMGKVEVLYEITR